MALISSPQVTYNATGVSCQVDQRARPRMAALGLAALLCCSIAVAFAVAFTISSAPQSEPFTLEEEYHVEQSVVAVHMLRTCLKQLPEARKAHAAALQAEIDAMTGAQPALTALHTALEAARVASEKSSKHSKAHAVMASYMPKELSAQQAAVDAGKRRKALQAILNRYDKRVSRARLAFLKQQAFVIALEKRKSELLKHQSKLPADTQGELVDQGMQMLAAAPEIEIGKNGSPLNSKPMNDIYLAHGSSQKSSAGAHIRTEQISSSSTNLKAASSSSSDASSSSSSTSGTACGMHFPLRRRRRHLLSLFADVPGHATTTSGQQQVASSAGNTKTKAKKIYVKFPPHMHDIRYVNSYLRSARQELVLKRNKFANSRRQRLSARDRFRDKLDRIHDDFRNWHSAKERLRTLKKLDNLAAASMQRSLDSMKIKANLAASRQQNSLNAISQSLRAERSTNKRMLSVESCRQRAWDMLKNDKDRLMGLAKMQNGRSMTSQEARAIMQDTFKHSAEKEQDSLPPV